MLDLPGLFHLEYNIKIEIILVSSEAVFTKTLKHSVKIGLLTD